MDNGVLTETKKTRIFHIFTNGDMKNFCTKWECARVLKNFPASFLSLVSETYSGFSGFFHILKQTFLRASKMLFLTRENKTDIFTPMCIISSVFM